MLPRLSQPGAPGFYQRPRTGPTRTAQGYNQLRNVIMFAMTLWPVQMQIPQGKLIHWTVISVSVCHKKGIWVFVRLFNKIYIIKKINLIRKREWAEGGKGTEGQSCAQTHIHPQSTLPLLCKPSKKCSAPQMPTEPAGFEVILLSTEWRYPAVVSSSWFFTKANDKYYSHLTYQQSV